VKLRIAAVIGLLIVGVGAVVLSLGGPGLFASTTAATYLTARAAVANVARDVAATGKLAAASNYSLRFGQVPVQTTATGSGGGANNASSTTWPVTAVKVTVGTAVKKGDVLATADSTYANTQLALAQANLAAAQTRLATDTAGPDDATKASALDQVNSAKQQLSNAQTNQKTTGSQNALTLQAARDAVTQAQAKLDADTSAGAAETVIAADQTALKSARDKLASTQVQVTASNNQAAQQVANAQLSLTSAQHAYDLKVAPASAAQVASDQAAVLTAQTAVDTAQTALQYATLVAPEDGVISAVNLTAGVAAPSGDAITMQSSALQVVAAASETDVGSLKPGMAATVVVSASAASLDGTLLSISPVAAGGSGTSVVTYQIVITLGSQPAGVLSGMTAQVTIRLAEANGVVAVPSTALNGSRGSYTVRVMDSAGQPVSRPVQVGLVTATLAEIQSGVTAGEVVVTGTASQRAATTTIGGTNAFGGGQALPGGGVAIPGLGR
jgi:multidrug efflux pump subunit AcrA (membrane-fusion protein)